MIKAIGKNGLILGAFALVTTSIIAITYEYTHERIEQAKERQLLSTLNQVLSSDMHNNDLHLDCIIVPPSPLLGSQTQRVFRSRLNGENTALIIETTSFNGYSGAIDLVVAIDTAQNVLGSRVVAHKETPGLGDKIDLRISQWILSFNGMPFSDELAKRWRVKKDGGQFDQFTGATITPRAVVKAVYDAATYGQANMQNLFAQTSNCLPQTQTKTEQVNPASGLEADKTLANGEMTK